MPDHDRTALCRIFASYTTLIDYCDALWKQVVVAYPGEFACRKGCDRCCELTCVNAIETAVLAAALTRSSGTRPNDSIHRDRCALLRRGACAVYRARPLICRTQGLVILDTDRRHPTISCCEENFRNTDPATLSRLHLFDQSRIVTALAKLNLAFCMTIGDTRLSVKRFAIADIAAGSVPSTLKCAIRMAVGPIPF